MKADFLEGDITETSPTTSPSLIGRVLSFLRTPLYRNGYALVLSSLSTSALGMVYWVLAAHLYPAEVVGVNSAFISAMMFLAAISQLNLNNGLIRFIRNAGKSARRFTILAYLISLAMSGVACLIFLIGVKYWSPAMAIINFNPLLALWFVAATATWCVFALQDGVLTGMRYATWVPIENTVYSLVKIALLIIFSFYLQNLGVFAAWTLGVVALILPINFLIFKKLLPKQLEKASEEKSSFATGKVSKFIAADYLGGISWMACTYLMPVIVTTRIGSVANAYFYLAWTIANTLYLIAPNIGSSLIAETSTNPDKVWAHLHRVFLQVASLVVPLALVLALGAPLILRIFGNRYSIEGALLLRLLALSAIPNIIPALFVSVARSQQRRVAMLFTMISVSGSILILSYLLMPRLGILGVGIAWLVGQTSIAIVILLTQSIPWFHKSYHLKKDASYPLLKVPPRLSFKLQKMASMKIAAPPFLIINSIRANRQRSYTLSMLPEILHSIPAISGYPLPETWTNLHHIPTVTDKQVYLIGAPGMIPVAVLKIPRTEQGLESALQEERNLGELHSDPRLQDFYNLVPKVLIKGEISGQIYFVEQIIPGITASEFLHRRMSSAQIQAEALAQITRFHQRTSSFKVIGLDELARWVDEPLATVQHSLENLSVADNYSPAFERLAEKLKRTFLGNRLPVSWVHGDFAPGNILVTPDGKQVTGFVDWELTQKESLPLLDLSMLLITTQMIIQQKEIGAVVQTMLRDENWSQNELGFWDWTRQQLGCDGPERKSVVLLCWLHHVANNISKSTRYRNHRLWVFNNIETVLRAL